LGKLRVLSGIEVCRILEVRGFTCVRQHGSHCMMQKALGDTTLTVPVPLYNPVAVGTLLSIIRQSRLPRQLFESRP